jgi:hypothetical protein
MHSLGGLDVDEVCGYWEQLCKPGYLEAAKLLLRCGADTDIRAGEDGSAWNAAVNEGRADVTY